MRRPNAGSGLLGCAGMVALALYVAAQILVPLRHFVYPGNVSWTEEGHRFSWHMTLRDKDVQATFVSTDPATGAVALVSTRDYLTERQEGEMLLRPDMILQFAHHAADRHWGEGDAEINVAAQASLNGRPYQAFTDPEADLADRPRDLAPAGWIVPLVEPPPSPVRRAAFVRKPSSPYLYETV